MLAFEIDKPADLDESRAMHSISILFGCCSFKQPRAGFEVVVLSSRDQNSAHRDSRSFVLSKEGTDSELAAKNYEESRLRRRCQNMDARGGAEGPSRRCQ